MTPTCSEQHFSNLAPTKPGHLSSLASTKTSHPERARVAEGDERESKDPHALHAIELLTGVSTGFDNGSLSVREFFQPSCLDKRAISLSGVFFQLIFAFGWRSASALHFWLSINGALASEMFPL
jgi:hypothetical protein